MNGKSENNFAPWGIRHWMQTIFFVLTIAIGLQFFIFSLQAAGTGDITVSRPPGVEGFLPIGSLMAWKGFVLTGQWDQVHPAGMVILAAAAFISLLLRKSFCSWLCPVGTVSEWLWKLGDRMMGKNLSLPKWLDNGLRSLKYVLLGFFIYVIGIMSAEQIAGFLQSPYYRLADIKMLHFFTRLSLTTGVVLAVLILLSMIFRNFWCRYLCPYGALMGIIAWFGPFRIRRNEGRCIHCGQCTKSCPYHLPVSQKTTVSSPDCSGCMDCISVCPVDRALEMKPGSGRRPALGLATAAWIIAVIFAGSVFAARISGRWESRISPIEFRTGIRMIDAPHIRHPSVLFGGKGDER